MSADNSLHPSNAVDQFEYPSSGAYSHLPIRTTITGDAAMPHPNADKIFLRNLPGHCYRLPNVPLNFTLVEIIVFLPNWFKNKAIASRFMNNCLAANVHFAILEEHRDCNFASTQEREKAKKTITDEYRKTMRSIPQNGLWTKTKHRTPLGWDHMLLSMDGFVPDDTRLDGYRRPQPIPFQDLVNGVKKLPEGNHAGDLTRAVQFAISRPDNLLFPDDLPQILEQIGRTQITVAHTDYSIARAYAANMRKEAGSKRPQQTMDSSSSEEERGSRKKAREAAKQVLTEQTFGDAAQPESQQPTPALMAKFDAQAEEQPRQTPFDNSSDEMDALLRPYLN